MTTKRKRLSPGTSIDLLAAAVAADDPEGPCVLWPHDELTVRWEGETRRVRHVSLIAGGRDRPSPVHKAFTACGERRCIALGHLLWYRAGAIDERAPNSRWRRGGALKSTTTGGNTNADS